MDEIGKLQKVSLRGIENEHGPGVARPIGPTFLYETLFASNLGPGADTAYFLQFPMKLDFSSQVFVVGIRFGERFLGCIFFYFSVFIRYAFLVPRFVFSGGFVCFLQHPFLWRLDSHCLSSPRKRRFFFDCKRDCMSELCDMST